MSEVPLYGWPLARSLGPLERPLESACPYPWEALTPRETVRVRIRGRHFT